MGKETLKMLARLSDTQIEMREIVSSWLLLTYDIPCTEAGNKLRHKFLETAKLIGAAKHTESVYLMPWTPEAELLALELAAGSKLYVWTSTPEVAKAKEITEQYDQELEPTMDDISDRIERVWENINNNRRKRALKMLGKTEKMLANAERAVIRRGSAELYLYLLVIKRRFATVSSLV